MQNNGKENVGTTRISDLQDMDDSYPVQINAHPNPYIPNPPNPNALKMPQIREATNKISFALEEQPTYRLPSRDIPTNTNDYMNDEQLQPNYIPSIKNKKDFVEEYEHENHESRKQHNSKTYRRKKIDEWLEEFQIPILVALLYFLSQLPVVNSFLLKQFTFLSLYHSDGNMNWSGLFLKSFLFGSVYYGMSNLFVLLE